MSLAGVVSGAVAQTHVAKDDREAWLQSAWAGVQALYNAAGVTLPDARLSVGVPPTAARARKRATAEAIPFAIWGDKARGYEVHVNPRHIANKSQAASALFAAASVVAGKAPSVNVKPFLAALSDPPASIADSQHAESAGVAGTAKQSTRLLRASCPQCAFVCRVAKKQADRGLPICGVCFNSGVTVRLELK